MEAESTLECIIRWMCYDIKNINVNIISLKAVPKCTVGSRLVLGKTHYYEHSFDY